MRGHWFDEARCVGMGLDWYSDDADTIAECLAVCEGCLVRQPCLESALLGERLPAREGAGYISGVRGGHTAPQRWQMLMAAETPKVDDTGRLRPLSLDERTEIEVGVRTGESAAAIGRRLGRSESTIARELRAAGGPEHYRASAGQARAVAAGGGRDTTERVSEVLATAQRPLTRSEITHAIDAQARPHEPPRSRKFVLQALQALERDGRATHRAGPGPAGGRGRPTVDYWARADLDVDWPRTTMERVVDVLSRAEWPLNARAVRRRVNDDTGPGEPTVSDSAAFAALRDSADVARDETPDGDVVYRFVGYPVERGQRRAARRRRHHRVEVYT